MYIGIDLGGTNIAAGLVSEDGKIILKDSVPTNSTRPTEEIVKDMAELAKTLMERNGNTIEDIRSVGIGCPGSIDVETGEVVYSNNIKMSHYPLAEVFRKYLDIPVKVDNDANCAALGEYTANGEKCGCFAFVTLGTGVGGGLVLNGKLFHGFNGAGGEFGHMTLVSGGVRCTCGKEGCWESYGSVTALIRQTKEAMEKNPKSMMHEIAKSEGKVSGRTAFEAAKKGDKAGQEVVDQYIRYVADGVVSLENIFQPDIIAIGGGISKEGNYLLEPIRKYAAENGFNKYMTRTKITAAKLFNDAGIIGAALI